MSEYRRTAGRWAAAALAATLLLSNAPLALAGPGDVNSVNDGQNVQGGMYYNTPGEWTTFQNSAGSGLYVQAGTTVAGREVSDAANPAGSMTSNGGNLFFNAPGQVVRVDGNIDIGPLMGPGGAALGNGGRVRVEAGFYEQNGHIIGGPGGQVQFNVGSMTMGPNASIQTQNPNGAGGVVDIKATGVVDIAKGAIIDTSGSVVGNFNTNVIAIQGGLVNLDGILLASGVNPGQAGGKIDVRATGNSTAINQVALMNAPQIYSAAETQALVARDSQLRASQDGMIKMGADAIAAANGAAGGIAFANGQPFNVDGSQGGVVFFSSASHIVNDGKITANGGNGNMGDGPSNGGKGGTVNLNTGARFDNNGLVAANGGHGGTNTADARGTVSRFYKGQELFQDQNGAYVLKGKDAQGNDYYTDEWGNAIAVNPADLNPAYVQHSIGQNGGNGGDAGEILVHYGTTINNNGQFEVVGGNGGDGQFAVADAQGPEWPAQVAEGGNGGRGGNGGYVEMIGGVGATLPSNATLANINVNGGSGGQGGGANTANACGCEIPGQKGECGAPGKIVYRVDEKPPIIPPPPGTPPVAPYPREYPRLGEALPPGTGQVLSYNRSIFLARSPLPIIQKRQPKPPEVVAPAPIIPAPAPKAKPQKKTTVRGFW